MFRTSSWTALRLSIIPCLKYWIWIWRLHSETSPAGENRYIVTQWTLLLVPVFVWSNSQIISRKFCDGFNGNNQGLWIEHYDTSFFLQAKVLWILTHTRWWTAILANLNYISCNRPLSETKLRFKQGYLTSVLQTCLSWSNYSVKQVNETRRCPTSE